MQQAIDIRCKSEWVIVLGVLTWQWTPPRGDPAAARLRSRSVATTDRQTDRGKTDGQLAGGSHFRDACALCSTYLQLPRRDPEGQLYDGAHSHADGRRRVHLVPHGVAVDLQGAAERVGSTTQHSSSQRPAGWEGRGRAALTPIPPQGSTAYIFWLIGPETANQRPGQRHVM